MRAAERVFRQDSMAGIVVSEITEGRVWGLYPIMRYCRTEIGLSQNAGSNYCMREFSVGDIFGPGSRVVSTEDPEICLNFLVYSFSLSVRLQVVSSGEGEVVFEEFPQFSSEGRGELRTAVRDDFVIKTKTEENFVKEKGGNPFGSDGFLSRAENYPLSKSMVDHDQERVKAHGDREIRD